MLKDVQKYGADLWQHTFNFLDKSQSILSRLAVLGGAVAFGAGVSWIVPMISGIEIPAWYGPATFFIALLIIAPFLAWREQKTEAEKLKAEAAPKLEILWNVLVRDERYGGWHEMYLVGVSNKSSVSSLSDVTLRVQDGWFARVAIQPWVICPEDTLPSERRRFPLMRFDELHPKATETRQLFGLSPPGHMVSNEADLFSQRRRFVLEARARDTVTVTAEFEYNPETRPMISRVA